MTLALTAVIIMYHHFAATGNSDQLMAGVGNITHGGRITHNAIRLALYLAGYSGSGSSATDVERAHRKLGAGFTD